jgi:hypothetical protein
VISSDDWVHLNGFLNKLCWKHKFTKTHGICQFKPLNLCLVIELCIYAGYVDGLSLMLMTVNTRIGGSMDFHHLLLKRIVPNHVN